VTERGQIKRLPSTTLEAAHPGGITCCRVADGDRIAVVVPHGEDDEIVIGKAFGQVLRIETGAKLRPVATAAAGTVAGVKVDPDDRVVSAALTTGDFLLSLHESGRALRVRLEEYPVKGRATAGVQSVVTDRPARDPAGPLALITPLSQTAVTVVFTDKGSFYEIGPTDAPLARRAANSSPLLPLGPGEQPRGVVSS
jgi:DNA gyrase subunit A